MSLLWKRGCRHPASTEHIPQSPRAGGQASSAARCLRSLWPHLSREPRQRPRVTAEPSLQPLPTVGTGGAQPDHKVQLAILPSCGANGLPDWEAWPGAPPSLNAMQPAASLNLGAQSETPPLPPTLDLRPQLCPVVESNRSQAWEHSLRPRLTKGDCRARAVAPCDPRAPPAAPPSRGTHPVAPLASEHRQWPCPARDPYSKPTTCPWMLPADPSRTQNRAGWRMSFPAETNL